MPPTTSAASAPPKPGEPAADGEGDGEDAVDIDAQTLSDARIVDRRPQLRAEPGLDQERLQRRGDGAAYCDDEQPVDADADAVDLDAPAEPGRQMNLLRLVADEVSGDRHRHQHEADREQHLIERACAIEAPIERALERDAEDRRDEEGRRAA